MTDTLKEKIRAAMLLGHEPQLHEVVAAAREYAEDATASANARERKARAEAEESTKAMQRIFVKYMEAQAALAAAHKGAEERVRPLIAALHAAQAWLMVDNDPHADNLIQGIDTALKNEEARRAE